MCQTSKTCNEKCLDELDALMFENEQDDHKHCTVKLILLFFLNVSITFYKILHVFYLIILVLLLLSVFFIELCSPKNKQKTSNF